MNFLKALFGREEFNLSSGNKIKSPLNKIPFIIFILLIVGFIAVEVTGFKFGTIVKNGHKFFTILSRMFPPDINYVMNVKDPLIDTIKMSFLGSLIGSLLAFPVAALSAVNINANKFTLKLIRVILSIIRTLPTLVIALIATYIFGLGTFAGTLAISIFTFGIVAKMLYEQIETVDMGPFEAMESLGSTKIRAFFSSVVPQILPIYISICLYSFEINVRYAAILGYVGAGGIGLLLNNNVGMRQYSKVGMVILMLFLTVVIIESTSRHFRERLN
ncbi:MAG: phosphonate ABC transporter, permease protein PhnE [Clostridiales bacterium]|nr:MAG: phosphonate ABC transporter, permease protein PhnE [Clostridiales bacterium]